MGIIPDKFILLEQEDAFSMDRIKVNLASDDCHKKHSENESMRIASAAIRENNINMAAVKKVCQGLITELDGTKEQPLILEEIARVLKLKYSKGARRPQRVILMGPPGSSTSEQAKQVCEKYNLVHVQVLQVLKDVIRKQSDSKEAQRLAMRIQNHQPIDDEIVIDLVRDRLDRPDCRINGWILEGCPLSVQQIKSLKECQITPQVVVAFEMSDEAVMRSLLASGQQKQVVERRLNEYRDFLACAETEYNKQLVRINCEEGGEGEERRVFLNFCEALEN